MAATVKVNRLTGGGAGSKTDITAGATVLSVSDSPTPGTANPIPIPASGTNYSYWATFRLEVTVTPAGTVDNIKFYTDGGDGFGTGVTMKAGKASVAPNHGYRQASSAVILNTTNHTGLDGATVDAFSLNAGSPLDLSTGDASGSISNPDVGDFGSLVVLQMELAATATPGTTPSETMTFSFDET